MTFYYPQAAVVLRIIWEDFGTESEVLEKPYTVQAQPYRATVGINSYREADTFECELDYKTFPFEPRAIKSCQVNVHAENMKSLYDGDGNRKIITPSPENAIFQGFADNDEITMNDSERKVRLRGRDFTSLFIDSRWPGKILDLSKSVTSVIQDIVDKLPAAGGDDGISVEDRTDEASTLVLAKFYPDFDGSTSGKRSSKKRESYWDVIQDICARSGFICYMELDKLVISKPRTLYDEGNAVKFLYGHNVKDFTLERKMGKEKGFNVAVRSVIDKEVKLAQIPKDSPNLDLGGDHVYIAKQSPKGAKVEKSEDTIAPFLSFAVSNVSSKAQLIEIGEKIFEELARQQIEGRFTTYDMESSTDSRTSITSDEECFNLLKLRNGTPVQIEISTHDLDRIKRTSSAAKREQYLIERCFDPELAKVFAETMGKYMTPFYTKAVNFEFSPDGFKIDVDFLNFIQTANKGLNL